MKRSPKARPTRLEPEPPTPTSRRRTSIRRCSPLLQVDPKLEKRLLAVHAAVTTDAFIRAVFRLLATAVRCDFINVCLRMLPTNEPRMLLDSRGRKYDPQYVARYFEHHPGVSVLLAHPGLKIATLSDLRAMNPGADWKTFEREYLREVGFENSVAIFFYDPRPPHTAECIFEMTRGRGDVDFSPAELETARRLHPHIETALRRLESQLVSTVAYENARTAIRRMPLAMVVLDWELRVSTASDTAREACLLWQHGPAGRSLKQPSVKSIMPPDLLALCEEMKREWLDSFDANPMRGSLQKRELISPRHPALGALIALALPSATPLSRPGFVVEFRSLGDGDGRTLPSQPGSDRLENMTARQRHLAQLVCEGLTNREIAEREHKAIGSIKNELHDLFKQLGINSRARLTALMRA